MVLCIIVGCGYKSGKSSQKRIRCVLLNQSPLNAFFAKIFTNVPLEETIQILAKKAFTQQYTQP